MYFFFKRAFDIIFALLGIILLMPLLLILYIIVLADSGTPAIFSQIRVGKGHVLFKMYKFRTMKPDTEELARYLYDENAIFMQPNNDPRLTGVGGFLRKYSLDELPQLFNILKGEMSFVGPRPLILAETNKLPLTALNRLNVLPGLTGLAQVEGRKNADTIHRCACDVFYAQNVSFWLDIKIIYFTFTTLLKPTGAF